MLFFVLEFEKITFIKYAGENERHLTIGCLFHQHITKKKSKFPPPILNESKFKKLKAAF